MISCRHFLTHQKDAILIISREPKRLKRLFSSKQINKRKLLVVHDEIHGFGSPTMVSNLSSSHRGIGYKLGLSATPEREYDEAGRKFIQDEIGDVIFEFPLQKAIEAGILCEFDYEIFISP